MSFYSPMDRRRSRGFSVAVALSIIVHTILLLVLFFGGSSKPRPKEPEKVITTVLVRQGKSERPKHLLPRKVAAPAPAPAPVVPTKKAAPVVKEEKKAPPKTPPNNTRPNKATSDRLAKLQQALAAANNVEDDDEGDENGDPEGTVSDAVQARLGNIYMSTVKNAVMPNFVMPNMVPANVCTNLPKAMVVIRVAQDGTIIASNLERSSGNQYFDNALIQAVKRTGTVPPPPEAIAERVRRDGIELYALCSHSL